MFWGCFHCPLFQYQELIRIQGASQLDKVLSSLTSFGRKWQKGSLSLCPSALHKSHLCRPIRPALLPSIIQEMHVQKQQRHQKQFFPSCNYKCSLQYAERISLVGQSLLVSLCTCFPRKNDIQYLKSCTFPTKRALFLESTIKSTLKRTTREREEGEEEAGPLSRWEFLTWQYPILGFLCAYAVSTLLRAAMPVSLWKAGCSGRERCRSRSISSVAMQHLPMDASTKCT